MLMDASSTISLTLLKGAMSVRYIHTVQYNSRLRNICVWARRIYIAGGNLVSSGGVRIARALAQVPATRRQAR